MTTLRRILRRDPYAKVEKDNLLVGAHQAVYDERMGYVWLSPSMMELFLDDPEHMKDQIAVIEVQGEMALVPGPESGKAER